MFACFTYCQYLYLFFEIKFQKLEQHKDLIVSKTNEIILQLQDENKDLAEQIIKIEKSRLDLINEIGLQKEKLKRRNLQLQGENKELAEQIMEIERSRFSLINEIELQKEKLKKLEEKEEEENVVNKEDVINIYEKKQKQFEEQICALAIVIQAETQNGENFEVTLFFFNAIFYCYKLQCDGITACKNSYFQNFAHCFFFFTSRRASILIVFRIVVG